MNEPRSLRDADATTHWRYRYECSGPNGTCIRTHNESEAFFWHLLGYDILRLIERTEVPKC